MNLPTANPEINIHSCPDEEVQRLQMKLLLSSFQTISPLPVAICRQILEKIPLDQSSCLTTISLRLFAGFTVEEVGRAEWNHIVLDEGMIWDPARLTWRPLYGAQSWLVYCWSPGAVGKIAHDLADRMAMLKMQLTIRKAYPHKIHNLNLDETYRAYCLYPDAFPAAAQTDAALWKKLQFYRRRGALLQRLTPSVVYRLKKPRLDDPLSGSTDSTSISTDLQLV
jgi:hypothetical protein